jgi:hypothetical protein
VHARRAARENTAWALWELHPALNIPDTPLSHTLALLHPQAHAAAARNSLETSPDGACLCMRKTHTMETVAEVLPHASS